MTWGGRRSAWTADSTSVAVHHEVEEGGLDGKNLVLGGHGFLGHHIVKGLLEKGHSVRVLDRTSGPAYPAFERKERAEVLIGDFLDADFLETALKGVKPIYHFISTTTPSSSIGNPIYDVESNLIGTLRLLQKAVSHGVKQVVFPSSGGTVYGIPSQLPVSELHPTNPISPHGIVKLAIEKYLHLFDHLYGLKYTILRIANPYGPGLNPTRGQGVINAFLWRLAQGEPIEIWGDGEVVRDYIYVDDVASATLMAAENSQSAKLFNVGSGSGTSLNELVNLIFEVTGHNVPVQHTPARAFDVPTSILSIDKIKREIGWQPSVSLADGIRRTWAWIQTIA